MSTELLVEDLRVSFPGRDGEPVDVLRGVSLAVSAGEVLGLVGESGSGKSMLALSMLRLIPAPGRITAGRVVLGGRDLLALPERALRGVRGGDLGMVFQDPMSSLNPVRRIGSVLVESLRRHGHLGRAEAYAAAVEALRAVGIPSPRERMRAYPHELSGGLRQRVMIALALLNRPRVLLADEPTTALDATIQAQILSVLRERVADTALILITHDLGVAAEICDRLAVMYAGRIVETGPAAELLRAPRHPYTAGLLAAVPDFDPARARLRSIPGVPPRMNQPIVGCAFAARCPRVVDACRHTDPVLDGGVACLRPEEVHT